MSPSETLSPSLERTSPRDPHVGRWIVWMPVLAWLLGAACLAALGFAIDMSGLEQISDSWGYLAGAVILLVMYGAPLLVLVLGCAVAGSLFDSAKARLVCATAGAALVAIGGIALAGFMLKLVLGDEEAGQAFGVGGIVIGLALVAPLAGGAGWRRRESSHPPAMQ